MLNAFQEYLESSPLPTSLVLLLVLVWFPRGDRLAAAVRKSARVPNPEALILTSALMIFWKCVQRKILSDLKEGICKIEKV